MLSQNNANVLKQLITAVENHMNCYICMDLMARPYGYAVAYSKVICAVSFFSTSSLSPCGHVLCMGCLQEWFRTAAPDEDDMDDDDMSEALVHRKKNCPVCRTVVRTRPIPLFVLKSIAGALDKHKSGPGVARRDSPPLEADPWAGIFLDPSADSEGEDDEDDVDDEDDFDEQWSSDGDGFPSAYGSDEEVEYEGRWTHPHWAPPNGQIAPQDYPYLDDVEGDELAMLRRGCTLQMVHLFHMRYDHNVGLQAHVDGNNVVYLGWNIDLLEDDDTGEEFMDWITSDIHERPERWDREENADGRWSAWKLVKEDEDEEFDTSDSEAYYTGHLAEDELDLL